PAARYEVSVAVDPQAATYKGHESVTFVNRQKKSTNYLSLFLYPNDPSITKSDKKFMTLSGVTVAGKTVKLDESGPSVQVHLEQPLQSGQSVTVEMDFEAKIPRQAGKDMFTETMDELMGMLNQSAQTEQDYGIFSSSKEILNLGMWYPAMAKYDSEGWDEERYSGIGDVSYFDPADFNVTLTLPVECQAATTGTVVKKIPQKDSTMEYHIESRMTRDFAIELSSKYTSKSRISDRTVIQSYFLRNHQESGQQVLDAAARAFEYYEKLMGPYPYTELDVVEAPLYGGAGGVEFPGLVTVSSMLYKDPDASSDDLLAQMMANNPAFEQILEFVVAHEVAHQWW